MQATYPRKELRRKLGTENLRQLGIDTPQQRRLWFETQRFWGWSIADNLQGIARAGEKHKAGFLVLPNWGAMGTLRDLEERRSMAKNVAE